MSMPFYVSPEQLMKDRADFARKGISRGRSMVAVHYAGGILLASENVSQALHKISDELRHRFGIPHATIQVEVTDAANCALAHEHSV